MIELVAGQNTPWSGHALRVRLRAGADLSAVLLDSTGRARDDRDLVFYNAPSANGLSWQAVDDHTQVLDVDLARIDHQINTIRCLLSVDDAAPPIADDTVSLEVCSPGERDPLVSYRPTRLAGERCLIGLDVYRRVDGWKVRAVGQGWAGGLAAALTAHGIAVEEPAAQSAPPEESASAAVTMADDDTVEGALRAIGSIRDDLSQAYRAHASVLQYADSKLAAAQEDSRTFGQPSTDAELEHQQLVARADAAYEQARSVLREELVAEEFAMPLPLARLDALAWEAVAAQPLAAANSGVIDTSDNGVSVVRLGSLYPPGQHDILIPMAHVWASRPLVMSDGPDRPPVAAAWSLGLVARALALTPASALDVQLLDLDGATPSTWGQLGRGAAQDVRRVSTPAEIDSFVATLRHQCDLVSMAIEGGVADAIDDIRDGARHVVVCSHFPHGYSPAAVQSLADCAQLASFLDIQLVFLTDDSTVMAERLESDPISTLLSNSLWLQDGPVPTLTDASGADWCFDAEMSVNARTLAGRLLQEGRRAR